ncbi:unnamed protein product [Cyclocybe aegerita]|uniref:Uncharacterized protein n=1 Tax=Cyclocybe aegerita TaxID=1973307 RepID=A0A8S0VRH5_CYCAE|nr:unnamed protein product [Cyclocybe aegerita]
MDRAAQGHVDGHSAGGEKGFSPVDTKTVTSSLAADETSGDDGENASTTTSTSLPFQNVNHDNSGTNSYALITPGGNQEFFINAVGPRIVDSSVTDESLQTAGGIKIGNGSTGLLFENSVFRTYTGDGHLIDLQALLNQKPLLPRGNLGESLCVLVRSESIMN